MKRPESPCSRDCEFRSETCHIDCSDYKRFKAEMQEYRAKVAKEKLAGFLANSRRHRSGRKVQHKWWRY